MFVFWNMLDFTSVSLKSAIKTIATCAGTLYELGLHFSIVTCAGTLYELGLHFSIVTWLIYDSLYAKI